MIAPTEFDSVAEYLRPLASSLPPALISPAAFDKITATVAGLPGSLAMKVFGFECKLGDSAPVADFQLQAAAAANARRSISDIGNTAPQLLDDPIWHRLRSFAEDWSDPASSIHNPVYNLWLEFDLDGPVVRPPLPSVFFGLHTQVPGARQAEERETGDYLASLPSVALHALNLLHSKPVPTRVGDNIARAMRLLPKGASVGFVGAMLPRNIDAFRLIINGLSREAIPTYLESIGWQGSTRELASALELTSPHSDYLWLNVDVGTNVYPKVSWECYMHRLGRDLHNEVRWRAFLDLLVERDLCLPEKADALLMYPGILSADQCGDLWPGSLRLLARLLGPNIFSKLIKGIHHVKVVFQTGKPFEAKAYLYARYE